MRRIALLLLFALLPQVTLGVTLSRITDFEAGTVIEADDMDAELDNILDGINGNIDSTNIVAGGIATANLATASVTTAKINALAVTRAKMEAVGQQVSSSSGNAQYSSATEQAVTNLSGTLTTTGRPVWVGLQGAGGTSAPGQVHYRNNGVGATGNSAIISFRRASATINQAMVTARDITNSSSDVALSLPCSAFWFLDTPSSGANSYEVYGRIATGDSGILSVENCKLVIFEL